jgi:hypothetical protein
VFAPPPGGSCVTWVPLSRVSEVPPFPCGDAEMLVIQSREEFLRYLETQESQIRAQQRSEATDPDQHKWFLGALYGIKLAREGVEAWPSPGGS